MAATNRSAQDVIVPVPEHSSKKRKSAKKDTDEKDVEDQQPKKKHRADKEEKGDDEKRLKKEEKKRKRKEEKNIREEEQDAEKEMPKDGDDEVEKEDNDEAESKTARKEKKRLAKEEKRRAKKDAKDGDEDDAKDDDKEARKEKRKAKKEAKEAKSKKTDDPEADGEGDQSSSTYTQASVLSALPQADIDAFLTRESVAVMDPRSAPAFRPILSFDYIPRTALVATKPFGAFKTPTPIQAASWPYTLAGRDVIGVAETGSGKTMAFALPCVEAVMRASTAAKSEMSTKYKKKVVRAIVVSPTRELAMQTHEQLAVLAARVGLECVCIYGGASKDAQRVQLRRADILVATPGRLKDFMSDGTADLSEAAFVVLDEADRMLDKGFEDDIKLIVGATPPREARQTLMFTATWPDSVQMLAATFMVQPIKLTIGSASRETTSGAVELQANARITQRVEVVDPYGKEGRVLQIIRQHQQQGSVSDRILVFCLYKKEATRIETFLAGKGVKVGGIHGDLRQEQRTRSLEAFKSGQTPVLVATDVAARGLDIPEVKLVLNVTFPLTIEDYVHRIGRTGRAGKTGEAITLFTVQDKAHSGSLVNVLRSANQPVPEELLKFGTTVKKKVHPIYGAFFKEQDPAAKTQSKITFDD